MKKSVTLARLDATGLGGDIKTTFGSSVYYGSYIILPNNEIVEYYSNGPISDPGEGNPFVMVQDISDYVIKEKTEEDGSVSYFVSLFGMDCPAKEEDGKVVISTPMGDLSITPNFHIHTGEIKNFVKKGTLQSDSDPCQYFDCEDDNCKFVIGENEHKVRVIINIHDFQYDEDKHKSVCVNCGAEYSSSPSV